MKQCLKCGKQQIDAAKFCTNCGTPFINNTDSKNQMKARNYIGIVISTVLIVIALSLVLDSEFFHYIDNISYYSNQYAENSSHSSGFLGGIYSSLASNWKGLYNQAQTYIVSHSIFAIIFSVVGGIGLYRGIKKLRRNK